MKPSDGLFAVEAVGEYLYVVTFSSQKLQFYVYNVNDIDITNGLWNAFKTSSYSSSDVLLKKTKFAFKTNVLIVNKF